MIPFGIKLAYTLTWYKKKVFVFITGLVTVMNSKLKSAFPNDAVDSIAADYNWKNEQLLVIPLTTFLIGYILGPVIFGPLSETYGRRLVMIWTFLGYTIFTLACAIALKIMAIVYPQAIFQYLCFFVTCCHRWIVCRCIFWPEDKGKNDDWICGYRPSYDHLMILEVETLEKFATLGPQMRPLISGHVFKTFGAYLGRWSTISPTRMGPMRVRWPLRAVQEVYPVRCCRLLCRRWLRDWEYIYHLGWNGV